MKKKILSLLTTFCMILAMIVGLNVTVFAAEKTGSVTIDGLNQGTEVEIYKMIDLNIDENGMISSPMYKWEEDMSELIHDFAPTAITEDDGVSDTYLNYVDDSNYGQVPDISKSITNLYFRISNVLRLDDEGQFQKLQGTSEGESITFTSLSQGQYLVLACDKTNGNTDANIYYPSVFNVLQNKDGTIDAETITMKKKPITIEKTVDSKPSEIGETKNYTIIADLPVYPGIEDQPSRMVSQYGVLYKIGDQLSEGLTLYPSTIKVFVGDSKDPLVLDKDYTIDLGNGQDTDPFYVKLKPNIIVENQGKKIKLTYSAVVNEKAIKEDSLNNTAWVEFNNDPFDKDSIIKITTEEEVYTYNLKFTKVDEDDPNKVLEGAKFELSKDDKVLFLNKDDSDYVLDPYQESPQEDSTQELVTDENGVISIRGLDANTEYTLRETQTSSDDYVLPSTVGKITLKDGSNELNPDGKLDSGTSINGLKVVDGSIDISSDTATFEFKLSNKQVGNLDLPVTGGTGTMMYTLGGLAVMGGAVYLFLSNKKKQVK